MSRQERRERRERRDLQDAVAEIGAELIEVCDARLYEEGGWSSWEEYCAEAARLWPPRWGLTPEQAQGMIVVAMASARERRRRR